MNRTKGEVELALDEFALEEVDRVAGRLGVPRARVVQRAVGYWLKEEASGRLAARPPSSASRPAPHPAVSLAVDVAPSDWEALQQAAQEHQVEPESLMAHAVLLLLADVHSGRVAADVARFSKGMEP